MSVNRLAGLIAGRINRYKRAAEQKGVTMARVNGSYVEVAGRAYPYDAAVSIPVKSGDYVYVVISDTGRQAVIVGR